MKEHTPAPWVFAYGSIYQGDSLHDESSIRIALMDRNEPHTSPVERDSNARLIAAAPELLEACQRFINEYRLVFQEDYQGSPLEYIYNLAVKAIDKATKE